MDRKPPGLDSAFGRNVTKYMAKTHVFLYRRTGGRIGGTHRLGPALFKPVPRLLLDHVGRSSGRTYTTPLIYLRDGTDLVVVASSGGMKDDPQWYRNLMAAPDTTVQVGPDVRRVHARTATPDERARLWPRLVEMYSDYDSYQSWTEREIPVVLLSPR